MQEVDRLSSDFLTFSLTWFTLKFPFIFILLTFLTFDHTPFVILQSLIFLILYFILLLLLMQAHGALVALLGCLNK